jgi:MinD-like ATPase involved in chromosome partitioning or flagellar assembly
MRRVGQGVVQVFRPAEEVQTAARFGEWVQHPITTGRRIAVTSLRGGAGKSTVAALLATVYGHYRQDRVLALDVDPGLGSLALRLGITPTHSLGDLDESTTQTGSFDDVQPYLTRAGRQLWVLPGTRSAVHDSTLDAGTYQGAAVPLSRFFALMVVDCGAGLLGELPRTVLSGAHAQILVTHATFDGAVSAREALDWMVLSGMSELVLRTVVVFVARNPDAESLLDLGRATTLVQEPGAGAVRFGYDRHVALGTTLDARRMAYATRLTGVRIAAEAMRRAVAA